MLLTTVHHQRSSGGDRVIMAFPGLLALRTSAISSSLLSEDIVIFMRESIIVRCHTWYAMSFQKIE